MAMSNRRYDNDDYIIDDEFDDTDGYSDEEYDEDNDEKPTASSYLKSLWNKIRGVGDDYEEESEDDEEAEEDTRTRRKVTSKRSSGRSEDTYEEEETDSEEVEYSDEDLDRFDEKFGTKGSSKRANFKRMTRERMNPDGKTSSKKQRTSSTSSSRWEGYRGNVKNILEAAPMNMDDIEDIASELMNDNAAIINLNGMRAYKASAISFLDGVSFAIKYRFEEIGGGYYICAPIGFMIPFKFDSAGRRVRR
ncbi:MAG: cell division protein SepF [bacterium]|nr:cell division protein SepF [bacterium]